MPMLFLNAKTENHSETKLSVETKVINQENIASFYFKVYS